MGDLYVVEIHVRIANAVLGDCGSVSCLHTHCSEARPATWATLLGPVGPRQLNDSQQLTALRLAHAQIRTYVTAKCVHHVIRGGCRLIRINSCDEGLGASWHTWSKVQTKTLSTLLKLDPKLSLS